MKQVVVSMFANRRFGCLDWKYFPCRFAKLARAPSGRGFPDAPLSNQPNCIPNV